METRKLTSLRAPEVAKEEVVNGAEGVAPGSKPAGAGQTADCKAARRATKEEEGAGGDDNDMRKKAIT